jgi:hypothetical protein
MNFVRRKLEEIMPRGRKPAPGKVYYLGRLRFRPGLDPPELEEILEAITGAAPPKRADILRAALLGGSKQAQDIVGKVEDSGTTDLLNDMFADF